MNDNPQIVEASEEEASIDFGKLFRDLLKHKHLFYKVLPITFVVSAIILISIPNYYKCTVKLSPELSSSSQNNSLSALASSFGIDMGKAGGGMGTEALFPSLYPDLVNSTDFKVSLFPVPVTIEGDKDEGEPDRTMSYYDYLKDEQKKPWWSAAISGTIKWVISLFVDEEPEKEVNPFRLTKMQADIIEDLEKK